MIVSVIGIIVMIIVMVVLEILLSTLYSNKGVIKDNTDKNNYEVSVPKEAALVFKINFWMGVFLFAVFGIFKIFIPESSPIGNFIFCIVYCLISLLIEIYFKNKKLFVIGDKIIIHKFLQKEKEIDIKDIDARVRTKKTRYGTASQIILSSNNKDLIKIDDLFGNYILLEEKLKSLGKI